MLAEMEAKASLGKDGSGQSMERADSGSRAECTAPTQSQRELAPPWDFNDTEHHLQLIKYNSCRLTDLQWMCHMLL